MRFLEVEADLWTFQTSVKRTPGKQWNENKPEHETRWIRTGEVTLKTQSFSRVLRAVSQGGGQNENEGRDYAKYANFGHLH